MKISLSSGTTLRATISALLQISTHQDPILHVQFSQHQVGRRSHHTSSNIMQITNLQGLLSNWWFPLSELYRVRASHRVVLAFQQPMDQRKKPTKVIRFWYCSNHHTYRVFRRTFLIKIVEFEHLWAILCCLGTQKGLKI